MPYILLQNTTSRILGYKARTSALDAGIEVLLQGIFVSLSKSRKAWDPLLYIACPMEARMRMARDQEEQR